MLLRYHKQIITLLIALLLWLPLVGVQAQVVDVDEVKITDSRLHQVDSSQSTPHQHNSTVEVCSSQHMLEMDKNCVSDGDSCQCHSSCFTVSMLSDLPNMANIYTAGGFLNAKKGQPIPLLILPAEIKPPKKL